MQLTNCSDTVGENVYTVIEDLDINVLVHTELPIFGLDFASTVAHDEAEGVEVIGRCDVEEEDRLAGLERGSYLTCGESRLVVDNVDSAVPVCGNLYVIVYDGHDRAIDIEAEIIVVANLELGGVSDVVGDGEKCVF